MNIKVLNNPQSIEPGVTEHCLIEFPYPCIATIKPFEDNTGFVLVNSERQVEDNSPQLNLNDTIELELLTGELHFKLTESGDGFAVTYKKLCGSSRQGCEGGFLKL